MWIRGWSLEWTEVPIVGVGSTPTCSNPVALKGVTEMHPGNYIYYDVMQEVWKKW